MGDASFKDVTRLHERVLNLQKHFGQANKDISEIVTSAEKVLKRGDRIEDLEFGEAASPAQGRMAIPAPIGRKATAAE